MATEGKDKPSGPCAACKKDGASRRCIPCRDVGIEIFFCNRDCQVKLWKTHKAVCGKAATTDASKNIPSRKEVKETRKLNRQCQKTATCQNCNKIASETGIKMSVCSKCKAVHYCSRECQVAHWPKHKLTCKQRTKAEDAFKKCANAKETNIRNLLEDWKLKSMMVMTAAMHYALKKTGLKQQPPTKVTCLNVEFNYNCQTFILAEEPYALPICDMPNEEQELIQTKYQECIESIAQNGDNEQHFTQFVLITCKDLGEMYGSFKPLSFPDVTPLDTDMRMLRTFCTEIHLKSDLFQGWNHIRTTNLGNQIIQYLKRTQPYSGFVQNALQLYCNKPRHMTHGILVHLKIGKDIGKIEQFVKYEVMTLDEMKELARTMTGTRQQLEYVIENEMDVHNSPKLLQSRLRYPKNIMMVTGYVDTETRSVFFMDSGLCELIDLGSGSFKTCKRDADYCFNQLQQMVKQMPSGLVKKVSL
ncbi:hypothetical protein CTEN210_08817 [Chaetoceros tenuissimus]|uniref:MYND-type domain-containing protein n=1 Tax=Chaetoceros tenuissimus TaxID=426638 RepID=A0AAD3CW96_9STRA|nr:hypothetical protein CTEN210_08817 [Chaetoceros tenuissimus]